MGLRFGFCYVESNEILVNKGCFLPFQTIISCAL